MKIGMYHFARMMTSKSTPVVVTVSPERIHVTSTEQVLLDASPAQVGVKPSKMSGAITLIGPSGKVIVAAIGSNSGAPFTAEQEAEIQAAQEAAAQDPEASHLELSRTLWVGRGTNADGSYQGTLRSLKDGDANAQRHIGGIVREALIAVGAQPA